MKEKANLDIRQMKLDLKESQLIALEVQLSKKLKELEDRERMIKNFESQFR